MTRSSACCDGTSAASVVLTAFVDPPSATDDPATMQAQVRPESNRHGTISDLLPAGLSRISRTGNADMPLT